MPAWVKVAASVHVVRSAIARSSPRSAITSSVVAAIGSSGSTHAAGTSPSQAKTGGWSASHGSAPAAARTRASISATTGAHDPSAPACPGRYCTWQRSVAAAG